MRLRYTATAFAELDDILSRTADDYPAAAAATAFARLRTCPHLGTETDGPAILMKVARPHRYLIFCQITGYALVTRNTRHPAGRHPPASTP